MSESEQIRRRVRADRHATSYPLIVVGAIGFHYAAVPAGTFLASFYGIPLAFVVVWALQWRTERRDGIGPGDDETLVIAFAVFLVSSLFVADSWRSMMPRPYEDNFSFWALTPAAVGLAAIGWRQRNRMLLGSAAAIVVGCALGEGLSESGWNTDWWSVSYRDLLIQLTFLGVTVGGIATDRRERAITGS